MLKPSKDRIDASVGVAAAGGDVAGLVAGLLVGGIGDGGADGVSVGVLMADYESGCDRHGRVDRRSEDGGK